MHDNFCEGVISVSFSGETHTSGSNVLVTGDGVVSFITEDSMAGINTIEVSGLDDGEYEINGSSVLVYTDKLA